MTKIIVILLMLFVLSVVVHATSPNTSRKTGSISSSKSGFFGNQKKTGTSLHKAILTQRGYIQFLRWQLPVPEIHEFTFCVWVKSSNLTYSHSVFSYSKNEKNRQVRSWIAPFGRSVHLEINNVEIFGEPTFILENQWYHICQSWDNKNGRYGLWIDGQNKVNGYAPEVAKVGSDYVLACQLNSQGIKTYEDNLQMAGQVITNNGDIVLGQEYTDFDKGLEEGIEGAVLGFNLLLASAFEPSGPSFEQNQLGGGSQVSGFDFPDYLGMSLGNIKNINPGLFPTSPPSNFPTSGRYSRNPMVLKTLPPGPVVLKIRKTRQAVTNTRRIQERNSARTGTTIGTPLGLRLIETSYNHCEEGRGSPLIGDSRLLISWTRTPVRVFGGAVLKNVDSQCGVFNAQS